MGYFLLLIALSIAGVAGYFSVYGLAHIFAAAFWSVIIMGGVLEVGKLVATSFLYRYWNDIGVLLRAYLFIAIVGLMAITSAGIFGYLSNAYQQDAVGIKDVAARIELLDTELSSLTAREIQINEDIGRIGSNYVSARQNLLKQYGPEKQKITARIAEIRAEKLELSSKQLEVEAHTGPIIYIAKAMGRGIDEAVIWMICLIIFVFDPLAVALTLAANIALEKKPRPAEEIVAPQTVPPQIQEIAIPVPPSTVEQYELPFDSPPRHDMDVPPGMQLVKSSDYESALMAVDELQSLESEITRKQDMIEQLADDNERLEQELFKLAEAYEKKESLVAQLREALKVLEQRAIPLSIEERAALHSRNQAASKT